MRTPSTLDRLIARPYAAISTAATLAIAWAVGTPALLSAAVSADRSTSSEYAPLARGLSDALGGIPEAVGLSYIAAADGSQPRDEARRILRRAIGTYRRYEAGILPLEDRVTDAHVVAVASVFAATHPDRLRPVWFGGADTDSAEWEALGRAHGATRRLGEAVEGCGDAAATILGATSADLLNVISGSSDSLTCRSAPEA